MSALIALLPQILQLLNNPTVQALLPLLTQLGTTAFPQVNPGSAAAAASTLFDTVHVKWIQTALSVLGENLTIDGVYGQGTKDAVSKFQAANNLVVDGWSGVNTTAALQAALLKKK